LTLIAVTGRFCERNVAARSELSVNQEDNNKQHESEDSSVLDDFFEMSRDNVCVAGFDGYFKRVNPSWTRTLGWTAEELMSRPVVDFVHPDDRSDVLKDRARLKEGEVVGPIINRYRCKDGTYRWFEWRSVGGRRS
jgi:PAS domain S-box-containing protein